jgi:hypothetical protein
LAACDRAGSAAGQAAPRARNDEQASPAAQLARTRFRTETIVDRTHGGVVAVRFAVPQDWRAAGSVTWTYSDVSWPVRLAARAEAPDGSAWIEAYPSELFYWMQPLLMPVQPGSKSLGMIYQPGIGALEAMQRYVVLRYRGGVQNLQWVGWRPVPNLALALGKPAKPGDSIAIRIRYQHGGEAVDEEFYGLLGAGNRVPYTGPQGTTYEFHRPLSYVISMGAKGGRLESLFPLLGFVAASFQVDPVWEGLVQQVNQQLQIQFNQYIARGYAQIQAAAQLSRTISANNDAWLAAQRQQSAARSASEDRIHENFVQYIRGTERVRDPYRGTSEQPSERRYHWTDAFGTVQHTDDPNYNPNIGSTTTWQKMEPLR